jgi:hypothetical protein
MVSSFLKIHELLYNMCPVNLTASHVWEQTLFFWKYRIKMSVLDVCRWWKTTEWAHMWFEWASVESLQDVTWTKLKTTALVSQRKQPMRVTGSYEFLLVGVTSKNIEKLWLRGWKGLLMTICLAFEDMDYTDIFMRSSALYLSWWLHWIGSSYVDVT